MIERPEFIKPVRVVGMIVCIEDCINFTDVFPQRLLPQTDPHTIADGLRTGLGALTWPVLRDRVDVDAMRAVAGERLERLDADLQRGGRLGSPGRPR